MNKVKQTERGWAGHFICANRCRFRRNTLLECNNVGVVISTVGLMEAHWKEGDKFYGGAFEEIGYNRYFETMAFYADPNDKRYHDIDVTKQIDFDSKWAINEIDADDKANDMHEAVVSEIHDKLERGELTPQNDNPPH
uniref:Uncharacterized protein n=1 Tax=viral metagenome TaxID=1070528 RepID=A0A6M3L237_9ZZZZ